MYFHYITIIPFLLTEKQFIYTQYMYIHVHVLPLHNYYSFLIDKEKQCDRHIIHVYCIIKGRSHSPCPQKNVHNFSLE